MLLKASTKVTRSKFSAKAIERLTLYHCILCQALLHGEDFISSAQIASLLRIDDSQVRKDLALCQAGGKAKIGYPVKTLKIAIEYALGFSRRKEVFIIGAGNLGFALAQYDDFPNYGIDVLALFDNNPDKIGQKIKKKEVFSTDELPNAIKRSNVKTVILTVPADHAQEVADKLVTLGIAYIWNFTPCVLKVPDAVTVHYENLMSGFLQLRTCD